MINFALAETLKINPRTPNCRGMSPVLFVGPDGGEGRTERDERELRAKAVCAGCPLHGDCLEWAIKHNEKGVWGGTNVEDRRVIKRRRSRGTAKGIERGPDELTEQQKARVEREELAWRLYTAGDLTVPEIALRLGVSTDTTYTYIRRQKRVRHAEASEGQPAEGEARLPRGTRYADSEGEGTTVLITKSGLI